MNYTVKCWNGIGPNLNGQTVEVEAKTEEEAITKALKLTGMERGIIKKPLYEVKP